MQALRNTVPWQDGWLLHPEPAPLASGAPCRPGFRLLAVPGEVTANITNASWRLVLRWKQEVEDEQAGGCAHGFALASGGDTAVAYVTAPATLCGVMPTRCELRLIGASASTQGQDQQTWIETAGHAVALVQEPVGDRIRWALAWTDTDSHQALVLARAALAHDAAAAWTALQDQRRKLFERIAPAGHARGRFIAATEILLGAIRPRDGVFPGRWLDTCDHPPGMDISKALLALPALVQLDPAAALEIFETILRVTAEDRDLHALVSHDPASERAASPLPLAATAALAIARVQDAVEFAARAIPRLVALLERQLKHARGEGGAVRWPSAEEALLPELYDDQLVTPDAFALLAADIDALRELAVPFPDLQDELADLVAWREAMPASLRAACWDEATHSLRSRLADGRHTKRATAADFMPLLCSGLDADLRDAAVRLLSAESPLRTATGLRNWERWSSDADEPTSSATVQLLALRALRAQGPADRTHDFERLLANATPPSWDEESTIPITDAALTLELLQEAREDKSATSRRTPFLDLLDRHRGLVVMLTVTLLVALFAAFIVPTYLKSEPTESVLEVQLGDAEMRYAERDYRGALALFEKLQATALRDPRNLDARIGDCWYRLEDWTRAEEAYRGALARNPDQPKAWMNRALTLFRMGRFADAAKEYREFIRIFGPLYPDLKIRAETALTLCDEQAARKP